MVDLSDHGDLMPKFLALPCPRMFMYGEENSALSYLAKLAAGGVELAEIPHSGHWPMYANPVAMWERIAAFIHQGARHADLNRSKLSYSRTRRWPAVTCAPNWQFWILFHPVGCQKSAWPVSCGDGEISDRAS